MADPSTSSITNLQSTFSITVDGSNINNDGTFNLSGSGPWDWDIEVDENNSLLGEDRLTIDGSFRHIVTPHAGEQPNPIGFDINGVSQGGYDQGTHSIDRTITPSAEVAHGFHMDELVQSTLTFTSDNGTGINSYTLQIGISHVDPCANEPGCGGGSGPLEHNRLQLDNGGDGFWILNSIFIGSDPVNGDYSGDMYYKVFPEAANIRCSGDFTLAGAEYAQFDDDWVTGTNLYTIVLSPATDPDANDTLTPDLGTSASEVILLGGPLTWDDLTGVPFDPVVDCPPAGFVTGFNLHETYIDTADNTITFDPAFTGLPQGDWAMSSFFPGGEDSTMPVGNNCGGTGDVSLSWLGSFDNADPLLGENQPDWTLLPGASAYGGFQGGGSGAFTEESLDGGAEFALLLDRPTLNMKVDAGLDTSPLVEIGLAGLNPSIGIDGSGLPTGTSCSLGVQLYSESSKPTNNADGIGASGLPFVGVCFINVGPSLAELGACQTVPGVLEDLGVNPGDPVLTLVTSPAGINLFTDGDLLGVAGAANSTIDWDGNGSADDGVYNSNQIPVSPSAGLVGVAIKWQAFTANAITSAAVGSNVARMTFRATI